MEVNVNKFFSTLTMCFFQCKYKDTNSRKRRIKLIRKIENKEKDTIASFYYKGVNIK